MNRDRTKAAALAIVVFLLNVSICRELFRIEYLDQMQSIEGAFIGMARYISGHWNHLTWFPLWNAGAPFPTTYPPLLNIFVALCADLFHTSAAHAYHAVTAAMYCLGPLALFALAWRFTASKWTAFAAGMMYSLLPFSAWIIPAVHGDVGGRLHPRRLQALVAYGEGPHVSSMTMLVIALLFLDIAVKRRRAWWFLLAAAAFGATVITNWLGAFATVLIVVPYVLAEIGEWRARDFGLLGAIAVAAYCLVMPLIPPSTIAVMIDNAKTTGGDFRHAYAAAIPQALAILVALVLIKLATHRLSRPLQFAILFAFLMTLVTLADAFWGIAIVPMGLRYHLEMEMALTLLIALMAQAALRNRPRWMVVAAICLMIIALIPALRSARFYARTNLLRPLDVTKTIEWREAQWLNQHWNGQRVFLAGSISIWLTAFSDTPELWGFDQAVTDYQIRVAEYLVTSDAQGGDHIAEDSILWLKALGVHAVSTSGPASTEHYHPFVHPKKFDGVLETLWRDGDDAIYRVGEDASPARVVPREAIVKDTPVSGIDFSQIRPYVAALDDSAMPRARFDWIDEHRARIVADLRADDAISLQIAWANGWHAIANGIAIPLRRDGLGLMYLTPEINGPATIKIDYDGGAERQIARWASWLAALAMIFACIWNFRARVILKKS